jgi:hypothetical protein
MSRSTTYGSGGLCAAALWSALVVEVAIASCGCVTGSSLVAASAYRKASVYGTSTAYVRMEPKDAFTSGVAVLAAIEDVEVTAMDEDSTRCAAAHGDLVATFRVFEAGEGRSRLSLLVGGGYDADANQELADRLIQRICGRFPEGCE